MLPAFALAGPVIDGRTNVSRVAVVPVGEVTLHKVSRVSVNVRLNAPVVALAVTADTRVQRAAARGLGPQRDQVAGHRLATDQYGLAVVAPGRSADAVGANSGRTVTVPLTVPNVDCAVARDDLPRHRRGRARGRQRRRHRVAPFAAAVTVLASVVRRRAGRPASSSCTDTGAPALPVTVNARCA